MLLTALAYIGTTWLILLMLCVLAYIWDLLLFLGCGLGVICFFIWSVDHLVKS